MKNRIARCLMLAAGFMGIAASPALYAGDRDYRALARENADIRADRRRLNRDLEHGRYFQAQRERGDLRRDYRERRELRHDAWRHDWR